MRSEREISTLIRYIPLGRDVALLLTLKEQIERKLEELSDLAFGHGYLALKIASQLL
jgi:hypothetical protein